MWLVMVSDKEILVLKNGKKIVCDRYETTEKNLTFYSGEQKYTLPKGIVDWEASRRAVVERDRKKALEKKRKERERARLLAEEKKSKQAFAELVPDGTVKRKPITMNADTLVKKEGEDEELWITGDEEIVRVEDEAVLGELAPQARRLDLLRRQILKTKMRLTSAEDTKYDVRMILDKIKRYRTLLNAYSRNLSEWSKARIDTPEEDLANNLKRCLDQNRHGMEEYGNFWKGMSKLIDEGADINARGRIRSGIQQSARNALRDWRPLSSCR